MMTITILGAGYVGLTTAALLAHAGYRVYVVEPNLERLKIIKEGRSFFFEEGLDQLIKTALEKGTLLPTDSYADSIPRSEAIFSCVGTPDNPDGSSDLTYIFAAAKEAALYLQPGTCYIQKSTVPVGTGEKIATLFNETVSYVSNPEFLREGTAIYDTLYFDRVVVGGNDISAIEKTLTFYRQLEQYRTAIATSVGITQKARKGQYITTSLNSAELIKVTANAFLALKISFANSIAKLADEVGADIIEVMDAVGADERIGRAFLNAGRGYGGGCFPKDVSGLISSGLQHGVDLEIMSAAQSVNDSMPGYIVEKLKEALNNNLANKKIAILGLAFKPGTSDTRRSPGIALANTLHKAGANVTTYDPEGADEAAKDLRKGVSQSRSIEEAIDDRDVIVIATEWPEIINYILNEYYHKSTDDTILVDATNCLDPKDITNTYIKYIGVGRKSTL